MSKAVLITVFVTVLTAIILTLNINILIISFIKFNVYVFSVFFLFQQFLNAEMHNCFKDISIGVRSAYYIWTSFSWNACLISDKACEMSQMCLFLKMQM